LTLKNKKIKKSYLFILIGFVLIVLISLIEGFSETFYHMLRHLYEDYLELNIHLYILGFVLLFYGLYLWFKGY